MSNGDASFYSVDTNVFMDWQHRFYPTDIFYSLPDRVDSLIQKKKFFSPVLVREELEKVGTADLTKWAKSRSGLFLPLKELVDVCRELGVSCINFLGLMRREKWKF